VCRRRGRRGGWGARLRTKQGAHRKEVRQRQPVREGGEQRGVRRRGRGRGQHGSSHSNQGRGDGPKLEGRTRRAREGIAGTCGGEVGSAHGAARGRVCVARTCEAVHVEGVPAGGGEAPRLPRGEFLPTHRADLLGGCSSGRSSRRRKRGRGRRHGRGHGRRHSRRHGRRHSRRHSSGSGRRGERRSGRGRGRHRHGREGVVEHQSEEVAILPGHAGRHAGQGRVANGGENSGHHRSSVRDLATTHEA
jgi:hypothetical protein